jgi:hypothetical protein
LRSEDDEVPMRCLVTTSRMPFALDAIRKLGRMGHTVYASDTFSFAPGNRSRFVTRGLVTPSPRFEPQRFVERIAELVRVHAIDVVLPAFEEALVLANHADLLGARLFTSGFETLHMLHHKVSFLERARKLGLPIPETTVTTSTSELAAAVRRHDAYFARPALSRGGIDLLTNHGPLAGALRVDDCRPTPENPWLVQPYVEGVDVCTYSVSRAGKLTAHVTYVHPRTIEHAGGIVLESVDEPEAQAIASRLAEDTRFEGQLSFDLKRTVRGYVLIECNPRPTSGICMLTDEEFARAVFDPPADAPTVAPPGRTRKLVFALLRDMLMHWREIPKDLPHVLSDAPDVYAAPDDVLPAVFQVLSYGHVLRSREPRGTPHRKGTRLVRGYLEDVSYDVPRPSPSA